MPGRSQAGYRLACQTEAAQRCAPGYSRRVADGSAADAGGRPRRSGQPGAGGDRGRPGVGTPHLEDLRSDLARVDEALARQGYGPLKGSLALIGDLSHFLRQSGWKARLAVRRDHRPENAQAELVSVLPAGAPLVGLAMDLGSTKLALYLVDLQSGATLARGGVMNPQIAYGEDVVSRIAFANRGEENR